jgi:hypothetical protein
MAKKSLEQLQYENEKIENDVNRGCAYVTLVVMGLIFIGCFIFLTA